jgi:hypothetical protein
MTEDTEAALIERYPYPSFSAPDDVTWPLQLIGLNYQCEAVWNEKRGHDFESGSTSRNVANGAIYSAAAERDRSGLQYAMTWCDSMLTHAGIR